MKLYSTFLLIIMFASCNNATINSKESQPKMDSINKENMVGNDSDEHGCKASAGYVFSKLKNKCIRVFEDGIRLNAASKNIDNTTSAFAVFKSEKEQDNVEIFLPTNASSIILIKLKSGKYDSWKNNILYLTLNDDNQYILKNNKDEIMYASQ